jgi:hypothetical protein
VSKVPAPATKPFSASITKEQFDLRKRQLENSNRWEREQPPEEHTPEWNLAAVGALYELLPESTRAQERDPERRGIRRMHELLAKLSSR